MITVWANKKEDIEIQELTGIVIPEKNGNITLHGKKIGYSDFFNGHSINHDETELILRKANKFCIWNS